MATLALSATQTTIGWAVTGWLTEYALKCRAELWLNGTLVDYDEQTYQGGGYFPGSTTSYSGAFSGLQSGTTYTVHVYAYRGDNEQTAHLSDSATTSSPPAPDEIECYVHTSSGWQRATPYIFDGTNWIPADPNIYDGGWNP